MADARYAVVGPFVAGQKPQAKRGEPTQGFASREASEVWAPAKAWLADA